MRELAVCLANLYEDCPSSALQPGNRTTQSQPGETLRSKQLLMRYLEAPGRTLKLQLQLVRTEHKGEPQLGTWQNACHGRSANLQDCRRGQMLQAGKGFITMHHHREPEASAMKCLLQLLPVDIMYTA